MDYKDIIDANIDDEIKTLQNILKIKSENGEPAISSGGEYLPFGEGVHDAFTATLKYAQDMGFNTFNVDNYGGHIDFGKGEEIIGIIAHVDVVPATGAWSRDPYSGIVEDGIIYGRGTQDDKGPLVAVLYAMKALKESGFEPARTVRLILGLDEETDWKGLDYYNSHVQQPDFGFTPDGDFPLVYGEKGILHFSIVKKFVQQDAIGWVLKKIEGGNAINMVPDYCRAIVNNKDNTVYDSVKTLVKEYNEKTERSITCKGVGKSLEIVSKGVSSHGAEPEKGLNAISIMMDFLSNINFSQDDVNDFIHFYNKHIGFDTTGALLNCNLSDEQSGSLSINVGTVSFKNNALEMEIDIRYPVTFSEEDVYDRINVIIVDKYNMGIVKKEAKEPIFMDIDTPMVEVFMKAYRDNTGDSASKPIVIGGGTYARAFENMLAFGALFPNREDRMHQIDEALSVEDLVLMTKIYADAIRRLASEDFTF